MIIVGIDFSINHATATIYNSKNNKINFVTVYNDLNQSQKAINKIIKLGENISDLNIVITDKVIQFLKTMKKIKLKDLEYTIKERIKLDNYIEVVDLFITEILKFITDDNCYISIEGLSFGSKGDQIFELGQATGILKNRLILDVLRGYKNRMYVISPISLKASYLKGNASKYEIFEKFIIEKSKILLNSNLYKYFVSAYKEHNTDVLTPKMIKSPWNDIVDSYIALHYLIKKYNKDGL